MMRVPTLASCLTTWLLAACAAGGAPAERAALELPDRYVVQFRSDVPPYRSVVAAPLERVAVEVPGVYEFLGLVVGPATNTRQLMFITPNLRITGRLYEGERNSAYLDCGIGVGGQRADIDEVRFAIYTQLREGESGETIVETQIGGTAAPRDAVGGGVYCSGTGKLERQIAELLRRRVAAGGRAGL